MSEMDEVLEELMTGPVQVQQPPNTGRRHFHTIDSGSELEFEIDGAPHGRMFMGPMFLTRVNVRPQYVPDDWNKPQSQQRQFLDALVMQGRITPQWVIIGYYDDNGEFNRHPLCDMPWWPKDETADPQGIIPFHLHWQVWLRSGVATAQYPDLAAKNLRQYEKDTVVPFLQFLQGHGMENVLLGGQGRRRNRDTQDFYRIVTREDPRFTGAPVDQIVLSINPMYNNGFGGQGAPMSQGQVMSDHPNPTAGGNWYGALDSIVHAIQADMPQAKAEGRPTPISPTLNGVGEPVPVGQQAGGPQTARMPWFADCESVTVSGEVWHLRPTPGEIGESAVLNSILDQQEQVAGTQPAVEQTTAIPSTVEPANNVDGQTLLPDNSELGY